MLICLEVKQHASMLHLCTKTKGASELVSCLKKSSTLVLTTIYSWCIQVLKTSFNLETKSKRKCKANANCDWFFSKLKCNKEWARIAFKDWNLPGRLWLRNLEVLKNQELQQKIQIKLFVSKIFPIEWIAVKFYYYKENTSHRQSMC